MSVACRVCGKLYDGTTHCSVNACRACAMFFKRCERLDVLPSCRSGKNNCKLDRIGRITCSACRFRKCIEAGLNSLYNCRTVEPDYEQNSETIVMADYNLTIEPIMKQVQMPTLRRFCYFYAKGTYNKRNNELLLLKGEGVKLYQLPGNHLMGQATQNLCERMNLNDIVGYKTFMNEAFPAYRAADSSFQDKLLYQVMFPLFDLTASFRTLRAFNDVNSRILLCTESLFADVENLNGFIDPCKFPNAMDVKNIEYYVGVLWKTFLDTTHRTMHRIKITDMEYLAVFALIILDEDNFNDQPNLCQLAGTHRRLIFKDLEYYYKNVLLMDNYVERVMNFKELSRTVKNNLQCVRETFYSLKAFNYYNANNFNRTLEYSIWKSSIQEIN